MNRVRTLNWPILLLIATFVVALSCPGAAYAADGHIQGTVTADAGGTLAGIDVVPCIEQPPGSNNWQDQWPLATTTAPGGTYDLTLAPGTYRLKFVDPSSTYGYQYWPNAIVSFAAQDIVLGDGGTITGRDESLPLAAMITGTVYADAGGAPIQDIDVAACTDIDGMWNGVVGVRTDASGYYELKGLPPGDFRVRFDDNANDPKLFASEFWNDVSTWRYDFAGVVTLAESGSQTGVDVSLAAASSIEGYLSGGGAPMASAGVGLAVDQGDGTWQFIEWRQPDGSGYYKFDGLRAGTYRMQFQNPDGDYITECWQDKSWDLSQGDDIVLGAGDHLTRNADLAPAGHITGAVTGSGFGPLEGVWVSANVQPEPGMFYSVGWDATDAGGLYDIGGLPTGSYAVQFQPGPQWVGQVYDGAPSWDDALWIDVTAGATTSGINAALEQAAHITGTVTGAGFGPLENVQVVPLVWRDDGGGGGWYEQRWDLSGWTALGGTYDIGGLGAGTYRLMFRDVSGYWATEFYNDAITASLAEDITLEAGGGFVADAELALGAHITGRVTSDGVSGIENVTVAAGPYDLDTWWYEHIAWAQTDADGYYDLGGLPAGTYRVQFWDNDGIYVSETYDNVYDWSQGTDITLAAGETRATIDAILAEGARITGTVTGEGSGPIEGAQAIPMTWEDDGEGGGWWNQRWDRGAWTDATGYYEITGLEARSWSVFFWAGDTGFASEYWNDAATQGGATAFDLGPGEVASGTDAELARAGTISGTVTGLGTDPPSVEGLQVVAMDPMTWEDVSWAQTAADGTYQLTGLRPGDYLVRVDGSWDWLGEWWQETQNPDEALAVTVVADADQPGVDFTLDGACKISGTVTPEGGGSFGEAGAANAVPMQWMDDGGGGGWWEQMWWNSGGVNPDGSYTIGGLAPGTYRVMFSADPSLWASEVWNDKRSPALGDDIVLMPGDWVSGIDAVLGPASTISGHVSGEGAGDLAGISVSAAVFDPATELWDEIQWVETDMNGDYVMNGLPEGEYAVSFWDNNGNWLGENYDNVYDWHQATAVFTSPAVPAENIDAVLAAAAYISGTVYGDGEIDPLPGIGVDVFEWTPDGPEWLGGTSTDENGDYFFGGLWGSDSYRVSFTDWNGGWATEAYADASSWLWGDDVAAWPGSPAGGIDVTLERAGSIAGTVYGGAGTDNPLPNAAVSIGAYDAATDQWDGGMGFTGTDPDGTYIVGGLKPGAAYRLMAWDADGVYAASFYDGKDNNWQNGDDVVPIAGDVVTADFHLQMGGHIAGNVTDGTDPIEGIAVFLYHEDPWSGFDDFWSSFDGVQAATDINGDFDIGGLSPGNYRIGFGDLGSGVYASEIWDDAPILPMGDTITVTDYGEIVSGKDAVLGLAGAIEGTVTDDLGNPIPGAWVSASIRRGEGWWESPEGWGTETDANGCYAIKAGLRSQDELFVFAETWNGQYLGEWWQEVPGFDAATGVHVPAGGSLTGIDFTLDEAAHITGTVSGDDGGGLLGLPNIDVTAYAFNGEWWDWAGGSSTDMYGQYDVSGLVPDVPYRLSFTDWNGVWGAEAYENKSSWLWGDDVTPTLADPAVVDATLELAGRISGQVMGDGVPLTNAAVVAGPYDLATDEWDPWAWDDTDDTGMYSISGLAAGAYKVQAWDNTGVYAGTFYVDEGGDWHDGVDVNVASGVTSYANFNLSLASHITGTVTDGVDPLPDIAVFLYVEDPNSGFEDFWASFSGVWAGTDANGQYDVGGLSPGNYRIGFGDLAGGVYAGEIWDDAPVLAQGDTITIDTYGQVVGGKDAVLAPSGMVEGYVRTTGGDPISGAWVTPIVAGSEPGTPQSLDDRSVMTDALGYYSIPDLRPQDEMFFVADSGDGWQVSQWYDGADDFASATGVHVPAGGTLSNVDFALGAAGGIGGLLTLERPSDGYTGIGVAVMRSTGVGDEWEWVAGLMGEMDGSGLWEIRGLPEGDYFVSFYDDRGLYAPEYYDDAITHAQADSVAVTPGSTATANATLNLAGHITGTVTHAATGVPGVQVTALLWDGAAWVPAGEWVAETDANGEYSLPIRSGTYRVLFSDPGGTYLSQYFSGSPTDALGEPVVVNAPDETIDIDAVLTLPSSLTANAEDGVGDPIEGIDVELYYSFGGTWELLATGSTGADGAWLAEGLLPGAYKLHFTDSSGTYTDCYYNSRADLATADPVDIGEGSDASITQVMELAAANSPPVADDDSYTMNEDTALTVPVATGVLAGDTDADGDQLTTDRTGATGPSHGALTLNANGSFTYTPTANWFGTDTFTYRAFDGTEYSDYATVTITVTNVADPVTYVPLEGSDRYGTAVSVSKSAFPTGANAVIVATGLNFPDALASAGLAGAVDGPVLLVHGGETTLARDGLAATEIARVLSGKSPRTVYIVGGPVAVSAGIESALKSIYGSANVVRLGGADRYDTARLVATRMKSEMASRSIAWTGDAFIVPGLDFRDALIVGPESYAANRPILLYDPRGTGGLSYSCSVLGVTRAQVSGAVSGTGSVPTSLTLPGVTITRIASATTAPARSAQVADWAVANLGMSYAFVGIATSDLYPDGLAAAPRQGINGAPLMLTPSATLDANVRSALQTHRLEVTQVRFFGGPVAITPAVRSAVDAVLP